MWVKGIRNTAKAFPVNSEDFSFIEDIIYTPINLNILTNELLEKIKTSTENNTSTLNGANWLLKAMNSEEKENQIIYCSIALESLLLNINEKNKGEKLAQRSKIFLKREIIYHEIKKMYNLRNKAIHEGSLTLEDERGITKEYILRIYTYVRSVIFKIILFNEKINKEELINKIEHFN